MSGAGGPTLQSAKLGFKKAAQQTYTGKNNGFAFRAENFVTTQGLLVFNDGVVVHGAATYSVQGGGRRGRVL